MPTVLVVDDSKFSRGRVASALEPLGYVVLQAGDGDEGLRIYDRQQPDVIVTDLLMPTLDGFGFLRGLKDRDFSVPVIVLSADIQQSSRVLCEELGVMTFMNKPFHAQELAAKVAEAVQAAASVRT